MDQLEIFRGINCMKLMLLLNSLDEDKVVQFLQASGDTKKSILRCTNSACDSRVSVKTSTFFSQSRLPYKEVLLLSYFAQRNWVTVDDMMHEMQRPDGSTLSDRTVADWMANFREIAVFWQARHASAIIGGSGVPVKLELATLAKENVKKGRVCPPVYVLRGVERPSVPGQPPPIFTEIMQTAPTSAAILPIVQSHLHPGTVVVTDGGDLFCQLPSLPDAFTLVQPDKAGKIVDPETGEITPAPGGAGMEENWARFKSRVRYLRDGQVDSSYMGYICDFLWRTHHAGPDCYFHFWNTVREFYPLS